MYFLSTTILSLLLALPIALSQPTSTPFAPSPSFRLHSHILDNNNPSFENLVLVPYHIQPAFNYAVLSRKSLRNVGIVGHINGTTDEIANAQGDLIFDYRGSRFPYGFVIDQGRPQNPVEINAGAGTKGVNVDQGFIKYRNPLSGGFYACNNTLPSGPAVQLFWKIKLESTPAACSDVQLDVEYV